MENLATVKVDIHLFRDVEMKQQWSPASSVAVGDRMYVLTNVSSYIPANVQLAVETCVASRHVQYRPGDADDIRLIDDK